MTIGKRIAEKMKEFSLTEMALAKMTGLTQPTIHRTVTGEIRNPRFDSVQKIAKALNVDAEWLWQGKEPKASHLVPLKTDKIEDHNTISIPVLLDKNTQSKNYFDVLTGLIMNIENLKTLVNFTNPQKLAAYSMPDDSMSSTFNAGDWLLIDQVINKINQDGIYLINYNNKEYLRRFQLSLTNELKMIADNNNYESSPISKDMIKNLRVIGKVIYAWEGRRI